MPTIIQLDGGKRQLNRDLLAVFSEGFQIECFAHGGPLARLPKRRVGGVVRRVETRGRDQLMQVLAEGLGARVTKNALRGRVPKGYPAFGSIIRMASCAESVMVRRRASLACASRHGFPQLGCVPFDAPFQKGLGVAKFFLRAGKLVEAPQLHRAPVAQPAESR